MNTQFPNKPLQEPEPYKYPKYNSARWVDPFPGHSGVLLADLIRVYAEKVKLIDPFEEKQLRPASYTLRAGREFYLWKKDMEGVQIRDLSEVKSVIVPPNGLIYVRFHEIIYIPYYMIARFNLRVTQVYRGALLGTGPQVDPGFCGHLNCPIHNLSDSPITINYLDDLATIDFIKTTPFGVSENFHQSRSIGEEEINYFRIDPMKVRGVSQSICNRFDREKDWELESYLPKGVTIKSSLLELENRVVSSEDLIKSIKESVDKSTTDLKEWTERRFKISLYTAVSLLLAFLYWQFSQMSNVKQDVGEIRGELNQISSMLPDKKYVDSNGKPLYLDSTYVDSIVNSAVNKLITQMKLQPTKKATSKAGTNP